jgi:hypothetical protein
MAPVTRPPRLAVPGARPPAALRRTALLRHPGCVAGYLQGHAYRRRYAARLARTVARAPAPAGTIDARVVSFSSQRDLPEQVASMLSFLAHAGRPRSWTVVSDGSHSAGSRALLESVDASVAVRDWTEVVGPEPPDGVRRAAERHPLGKKLALLVALPVDGPTLACDSDVLFSPGARDLGAIVAADPRPRYQLDCFNVLDARIVPEAEQENPTNTGFLVLHEPLDWRRALSALDARSREEGFFGADGAWVEQGIAHLALRDSGAVPLDPGRFVIRGDDHLRYRERGVDATRVMRHYAGPTRYMMWVRVMNDGLARSRSVRAQ